MPILAELSVNRRRRVTPVFLIGAAMIAAIISTYSRISPTYDEGFHIAAGIEMLEYRTFRTTPEHTPLSRWFTGVLPFLSGVRYSRELYERLGEPQDQFLFPAMLFEGQTNPSQVISLGRIGTLAFVPLLLGTVYCSARRFFGYEAALAALLLAAFSPNLLAHGGLATTDFAAATLAFAAAYSIYLWAANPTQRNGCTVAAFVSLSIMTKLSAVPFLAVIGVALVIWKRDWRSIPTEQRRSSRANRFVKRVILYLLTGAVTVWVCYGLRLSPMYHPGEKSITGIVCSEILTNVHSDSLRWVLENIPLPFTDLLEAFLSAAYHTHLGHYSFLMGEVERSGVWYYFLVVVILKSTLPLMIMAAAAVLLTIVRRKAPDGVIFSVIGAVAVVAVGVYSSINIGVRHILPAYPFLALLAASIFQNMNFQRRKVRASVCLAGLLVAAHVFEGLTGLPDNISYFNQIARGREHLYLGDSNLDWGQGLYELSDFVHQNNITTIHLWYFGSVDPRVFTPHEIKLFGFEDRPTGWVAVSMSRLQGIYQPKNPWLERRNPVAKAGKSIWIFHIRENEL